jgi:hypothetical protein
MADDTSTGDKAVWGLLGLVVGAGTMYVLAKEDIYRPNPLEDDVEVLGTTGDVNALDYGGGVIFRHPDGHVVWEWWDEQDEGAPSPLHGDPNFAGKYTVYSVHVPDPGEVMSWYDWVDYADMGNSMDMTVGEYRELCRSKNPIDRVRVIEDIEGYHGPHELDQYPQKLSRAEMEKRWPMFA